MSVLVIPTRNDLGNYSIKVRLNEELFTLTFKYNERDTSWYFDIDTEAGASIVQGLKAVPNYPVINNVRVEGRPAGEVVFLDSRADPQPPTQEELGEDVPMTYKESEDDGDE